MTRIGERLVRDRRETWERWYGPVAAARWTSAAWHMLSWAIFGAAYVGAVVFVSSRGLGAGALLLVLAAGSRLSAYISATVGEIGFLRGFWLEGSRRLAWLEDYAAAVIDEAAEAAPARLARGIRFERVSFAYPGTTRCVLEDINLDLKAGSVVAIVGENGAGKSTLVKLLCRMYVPDQGRILVDGADLAKIPTDEWRARLAGAFQDFFRFEFRARHTVGLGDIPRLRGPAGGDCGGRPGGRRRCGGTAAGAAGYSAWRNLARRRRSELRAMAEAGAGSRLHARCSRCYWCWMSRPPRWTPRPSTRCSNATRPRLMPAQPDGRITILVSHRFSTVRMADQIVVLDGARVVETGTHEELLAKRGQYAELYNIQAAAYR